MSNPRAENESEAALRESDEHYRSLFELSPCAVMVQAEGRIALANEAVCQLLGATDPAQVLQCSPLEFVHPEARSQLREQIRQVLENGQASSPQKQKWLRVDGAPIEAETVVTRVPWSGKPAVQLIVRDIAVRREIERSLREAEQRIRAVTEKVPDFAVFGLDDQGRVESWNLGAERLFGFSHAEIVGQNFAILFTPEDRAAGGPEEEIRQASVTGVAQDERWHLRKDGTRFFASGLLVAVRNAARELTGFTKVAQDATQRKRAQEALQQSEARYRQLAAELDRRVTERTSHLQQSVEAWESFCYTIAHDLRAPLRTISGFAGALLDDYGQTMDGTAREYAQRIVSAAYKLDQFIQDLLEFGRMAHTDLPLQEVDLTDAINQALHELAQEIHSSRARIESHGPFPTVFANPAALKQVITNLLTNAMKFVIPGDSPHVEIRSETRGRSARLLIRDHGIGISPEHHERVFQLFERLHGRGQYPGTGAGLAIVRKAMERMTGRIGLESHAGQGASFWIELPLAAGAR